MSKKAWHISYISAMVGPCAATTDCGMMVWGDGDYPEHTDELKIYQLVGYAINCDLPYSITEWAEFMEDEEQEIGNA